MKKLFKIFKLARIFKNYRSGRKRLDFMPIRLWLEPTSRCNLRCTMCPNGLDYDAVSRGDLDFNLFKKIVDQAAGFVDDINLFHRGEPLLHPQIVEMVRYINRKNIPVRLHTNATLLDGKMAGQLADAGLDYISVSFDGYDKATYERVRRGAEFEKVMLNVINLLTIKKEKNLKKPLVVVQLMDFSKNSPAEKKKNQAEFMGRFKNLPLDQFTIRTPHNWAGLWGDKSPARGKYSPCLFPFYSLTVLYDGTVLACPQDFYGKLNLGNVAEKSLGDIWNSENLQALRKNLHFPVGAHPAPCATCDVPYRKNFLGLTSGYLKTFIADKIKIIK